MKRKALALKARRRLYPDGTGAARKKRDHTRTSSRHRRALRMEGRRPWTS